MSSEPGVESMRDLLQRLVRIPTQAGIDRIEPAVDVVEAWLADHDLKPQRCFDGDRLVGVTCTLEGSTMGPAWVLDATLDTAPIGDPDAWTRPPTGGEVVDGWVAGRGSADSKAAVAVFCHLAAWLRRADVPRAGDLVLLFDGDEHSGEFAGARTFFGDAARRRSIGGVMIGYPGNERVVCGGRGFLRARLRVCGPGGHSGSSRPTSANAVSKAARLVTALESMPLPSLSRSGFPLPPKLTVTGMQGGEGFSVVPGRCDVEVDLRLVPDFDRSAAEEFVGDIVAAVDGRYPEHPPTAIDWLPGWPPFQLPEASRVATALVEAAEEVTGRPVPRVVAGPSNIGNYLASLGIEATAGFGVAYRNLHAPDEAAEVSSLGLTFEVYRRAVLRLLGAPSLG